jgi:hypothetical protein
MTRGRQLLVALCCFVGGCVCAIVGSVGYEHGVTWLDKGAAYPTGALWGLAVVFFLRAVLAGRPRRWMYPIRYDRDADTYGRHHRSD